MNEISEIEKQVDDAQIKWTSEARPQKPFTLCLTSSSQNPYHVSLPQDQYDIVMLCFVWFIYIKTSYSLTY